MKILALVLLDEVVQMELLKNKSLSCGLGWATAGL